MTHAPEVKVWVNKDRTILVRQWGESMTIAVRDHPDDIWGPPVLLERQS